MTVLLSIQTGINTDLVSETQPHVPYNGWQAVIHAPEGRVDRQVTINNIQVVLNDKELENCS